MTIRANEWYRVKSTQQYCRIQRIPSTKDPRISVPRADENTKGFELAMEWYSSADAALTRWTKRVMIMDTRKALGLLREPEKADLPIIESIKAQAAGIPVSSASRDGEFTMPVEEK